MSKFLSKTPRRRLFPIILSPFLSKKEKKKEKKIFETIPYLVFAYPCSKHSTSHTDITRGTSLSRNSRKNPWEKGGKRTLIANRDTRMTRRTRLTVPCCSTWAPTTPWDLHSHVTDGGHECEAHRRAREGWGLRSCAVPASSDSNFHFFFPPSFPPFKCVISGISRPRRPIIGYGMQSPILTFVQLSFLSQLMFLLFNEKDVVRSAYDHRERVDLVFHVALRVSMSYLIVRIVVDYWILEL